MSNPWDDFSAGNGATASDGPWSDFSPPPAPTASPQATPPAANALQRGLASPGARFAKGAVLDPAIGTMEMIQSHAAHAVAPFLDPVGTASDLAGLVSPNNAFTAAHNRDAKQQSDAVSGLNDAFTAARSADERGSGFDPYNAAGTLASLALPLPGGKAHIAAEIPDALSHLPETLNAAPETITHALDYVGRLAKGSGSTADTIAAANPLMTGAEAIGRPGVTAMTALARRSGTTPDKAEALLTARHAAAPERILSDLAAASGTHPEAAAGNLSDLVKAGRSAASPLYDEAYSQAPVITDRLQQFAHDPIIQRGMKEGIITQRIEALGEGKPFDPSAYAITEFNAAGDPVIGPVPTWRTWDAAKTGLDDMLEGYRDGTTGRLNLDARGRAIDSARRGMLTELDSVNPSYATARSTAGDYLGAKTAFSDGMKNLNGNVTAKQFADIVSRASSSPPLLESLRGGVLNSVYNMAQKGQLKPTKFLTPLVQSKLNMLFGKEGAAALVAKLQNEAGIAATGARMRPGINSTTGEVLNATGEQDTSANLMAGLHTAQGVGHAVSGNWLGAARHGLGVLNHLGAFAHTPGMPEGVRNAAGDLLMMAPKDLAELLRHAPPPKTVASRGLDAATAIAPRLGLGAADVQASGLDMLH